jgi:S-(hydroxymethyl)glutathione dehydrogenase / alcohol dehydrogenase
VPELVRLYLDGQLDLDAFVSHRMPLDDVNHAFELMERQDGIRSVLSFA